MALATLLSQKQNSYCNEGEGASTIYDNRNDDQTGVILGLYKGAMLSIYLSL